MSGGVVATSQPLAARAGAQMLREGGSAADAAVAAAAVLAVVEPNSAGPGGDLFALYWSGGRLHGLNASGWAPAGDPLVTVPGAVDGWARLHERFGRLPFAHVLEPAAEIAERGFVVTEVIRGMWREEEALLARDPDSARTFLRDGRAPDGVFDNPDLARTLRLLQAEGPRAFYEGEIARAIVEKLGGAMTPADLAEFESEWVEPISTTYRGHEVHQMPPNTQGFAVLEMLNLLEAYELDPAEQWHLMVEAKKLAYADLERHNADPRFADVPVGRLISKEHAAALRERIDRWRASEVAGANVGGSDTIALVAADAQGDMVSLIYSVYTGFGSGLTVRGFVLHNRGALFSHPPNEAAPRKRPFHTLIPGFVTRDGAPLLAFGTPGGSAQPQTQLALLVNLIDHGMDVQAAIDAPRFVHDQATNVLGLEPELYERVGERLAALGHRVERSGPLGGLQAIRLDDGVYRAGSDRRKDGEVALS